MEHGLLIFPTDQTIAPDVLAAKAEERGFTWLLFPEHTHIPATAAIETPGGEALPDEYRRMLDPFIAAQAALQATTTLRSGPGVVLLAQRDALQTAKEAATVDFLSHGRLVFGIGYGWNREELANHGVVFGERRAMVAQKMAAIRELWTQEVASSDREHARFGPVWAWPKPIQPGGPPVVLGAASGPRSLEHLIRFCDGWMPIPGRGMPFPDAVAALRDGLEAAGRARDAVDITLYAAPDDPDALAVFERQGAARALHELPSAPADVVLKHLDALALRHLP